MSVTATAIAQAESKSRLAAAMHHLFDNLRPFMRAYAKSEDQQKSLPPLDMVWVSNLRTGPAVVLQNAIRSYPVLWAAAIPEDCCIVPRKALRDLIGEYTTESLAITGAAAVENSAARFRHLTN